MSQRGSGKQFLHDYFYVMDPVMGANRRYNGKLETMLERRDDGLRLRRAA